MLKWLSISDGRYMRTEHSQKGLEDGSGFLIVSEFHGPPNPLAKPLAKFLRQYIEMTLERKENK